MTGKTISVTELKPMDAFRSGGYEYVFLGRETCWNKNIGAVQYMHGCAEVEYVGTMEFSPYIPPDWRNLLVPRDVDYDILIKLLDEKGIVWQPYPRGLFPRRAIQVRDNEYRHAQMIRINARRATNVESGPFSPETK